jgi:hypothetical protein
MRIALRCSFPYVGAMHDNRTHEMIAWLRSLPPHDRLAAMYAVSDVFPVVKSVSAWTAEFNDTLAALQLTPREHEVMLIAAAEFVERLTANCNPASRRNEQQSDPANPEQHLKASKRSTDAWRM